MTRIISRTCGASTRTARSLIALLAIATLGSTVACAPSSGWTPVQIGFFNPGQLFTQETDVHGMRISVPYTRNENLYGLDAGIASTAETLTGVQTNFLFNGAQDARALQMTICMNSSIQAKGVQMSVFNLVEQNFTGLQLGGLVNTAGDAKGAQIAGIHNRSESIVGLQISSLVNETNDLRGLQLGALNFNDSGPLPFFPIFNFGWGSDSDEDEDEE
ncbi:MAG: hypothetical protein JRE43_11145 [Deltaproteobacteria bacterium]|nr:hypothetical protein [Deltaproteobacteria bacterium]MBW2542807.1 hypothetical protein [Deltaproteobacteria bacterium]